MPIVLRTGSQIDAAGTRNDRTYVNERNIRVLKEVAALDETKTDLFVRADGITDALPRDSRIQSEELERLAKPTYANALFPEEKVALPQLWRFMEWPTSTLAPLPTLPPALNSTEKVTLAPRIDFNQAINIELLPRALQESASRSQLVQDQDQTPTTISIPDIENILANPGPFMPKELKDLKSAIGFIRNHLIDANDISQMKATTLVPQLGTQRFSIPETNDVLAFSVRTNLVERPSSEKLTLSRETYLSIDLAPGQKAVILDDENIEALFTQSDAMQIKPGIHRFELWENGERTLTKDIDVGAKLGEESIDLDAFNHTIKDEAGNALHRHANGGSYRFSTSPLLNQPAKRLPVPAGSYEVTLPNVGDVAVHVFPDGAIRVDLAQEKMWLAPSSTRDGDIYVAENVNLKNQWLSIGNQTINIDEARVA